MTKKLDVTVSNMIWASPADGKLLRKAREMYSIKSYNEKACSKCEFLPDRHTDECDDCPNFLANYELWKEKGDKIGVPRGDTEMAAEWLDGYKYKMRDKRIRIPFKHKIKMTVDLRDTQVPAVKAMLKKKNGQMESPPRSGKTVMTIVTAIERGQRTLILASQYDYLAQFYETLVGGPSNKAMTNIPKIEERLGRPICGIVNTPEQMKGLDIVLCTYQSFISKKGKKQLKKIKRLFGTVIIDEVQTASAPCFSSVINAMEAESRIGVSGTTERKDGLNKISDIILGPVFYRAKIESLVPRVKIVRSPADNVQEYKIWTYAMRYLYTHDARNELIADLAFKLIKQGRSVVIPTGTIAHVGKLTKLINERCRADKKIGRDLCMPFTGAHKKGYRDDLRRDAINGKVKCIVGIARMVQVGINVPPWSDLIVVTPISNTPNFTQMTARIRTPMEGKKTPQVHHIMESFGPSVGCFRTCYFQTYIAGKFQMKEKQHKRAQEYLSGKKKNGNKAGLFGSGASTAPSALRGGRPPPSRAGLSSLIAADRLV